MTNINPWRNSSGWKSVVINMSKEEAVNKAARCSKCLFDIDWAILNSQTSYISLFKFSLRLFIRLLIQQTVNCCRFLLLNLINLNYYVTI